MAPLLLEGATLGKRHQHYNQLLKDATTNTTSQPAKIDYNKTDIENFFNIDIASNNHDIEYILDVLQGEDMLYVSRAIKRSNWLFTDAQYAHIFDPEYLHSQLFPQMMPKASCKLLLHIRLTLKDESQVDKFFKYFKEKDLKTAVKWLPNCSIRVIEDAVKKHALEIPSDIFGRLCKRSSNIFEIFVKATQDNCPTNHLGAAMFLLDSNLELFLDTLEKRDNYRLPSFNKKYTELLMKKCPQRIIDKFEKYIYSIDADTFAKCLKKEDIKPFLLKQLQNKDVKHWFDQDRIGNFTKYMLKEEKYTFAKQFIDKTVNSDISEDDCAVVYKCAMSSPGGASNSTTYRWYKYLAFEVAFPELKKLIRTESNPDERNAMLMTLAGNTRKNLKHIHTLLQYYRERHINEPFRFKVQFTNDLLQKTDPHLYDVKIWTILDEIFRSMEVYIESENNVQTCVKAIIVYKITHDEPVPAVIEQKFIFDFLKSYQRKLDEANRAKLFNYLFNLLVTKLNNRVITNQLELDEYAGVLKEGLNLLKNWNKDLVDYPILINKINDCVKIKKEKGWSSSSLTDLYETKKSWKKHIFENSLVLSPTQKACMNALKHNPELLVRHKNEVDALCCNDAMPMKKVLDKIRIYWPQTLANEWTTAYRQRLDKSSGHKALIRGLCCLLDQNNLLAFLKKYEPKETKINWVDADEHQLSLVKNIAQNMHIARPQVSPDAILWYAKGDYVQFTQPALNSILYNLRPSHSRECIQNLLSGTVSLQKLGINLSFAKLSSADMRTILGDIWTTTKNPSVRAALFQNTHKLLCKEQDESLVRELWDLMQTFIDNLTAEENKVIYSTFGNMSKVHSSVKPAYCIKSYSFLKALPSKVDCKKILSKIKEEVSNIIDELDSDFVASIIEEFVKDVIVKKEYEWQWQCRIDMKILTTFLLSADDERIQTERFEKVFVPLMDKSISLWDKTYERNLVVKENFIEIIQNLNRTIDYSFLKNKAKPSPIYQNILKKLESTLPTTQNIVLFRQLKLSAAFIDIIYKNKSDSTPLTEKAQLDNIYSTSIPDIGNVVLQYLKEDVNAYHYSLMHEPVTEALERVFDNFGVPEATKIKYFKNMLGEKDFIPICLLVIQILRSYFDEDQKEDIREIRNVLVSHPSPVVQIHYFMKFGSYTLPGDDD